MATGDFWTDVPIISGMALCLDQIDNWKCLGLSSSCEKGTGISLASNRKGRALCEKIMYSGFFGELRCWESRAAACLKPSRGEPLWGRRLVRQCLALVEL